MSAAGEAWVRHRMECPKCREWHNALPDAKRCRVGEKMYRMMAEAR